MESRVQIEQIIGRLLRQPNAERQPAERLNTASFYVRVDRNEVFNEVLANVSLRLSKEAPGVKIIAAAPDKPKPATKPVNKHLEVPATAYNPSAAIKPIQDAVDALPDYRNDTDNTRGVGERRIVLQRVGDDTSGQDTSWVQFEQSNLVSARWVFAREIKRRFAKAIEVVSTADPKFDAMVALGSRAFTHVAKVACEVVDLYVANVSLVQRKIDPYVVGDIRVVDQNMETFTNGGHEGYDGLSPLELEFAKAIDATGKTWVRNIPRLDYGIPLISIGTTSTFYPDFLIWERDRVIALDTKGEHLLLEAAGRKLLNVNPPLGATQALAIRFISKGKFNDAVEQVDRLGYTLWLRREDGTLRADQHDSMPAAVAALLD